VASAIEPILSARRPSLVINAAAYTAVDDAERDTDACFALNRDAPRRVAEVCAMLGVPLIHLSTDYVFDGCKGAPYVESDAIEPLNVYGQAKAAGEQAALSVGRTAVVRTSWVYSAHGRNFVSVILAAASAGQPLDVVETERGRPTSAEDLAGDLLALGERLLAGDAGATGLFHIAGLDDASRAEWAEAIVSGSRERGGPAALVRRIAHQPPRPARRPRDTRLDSARYRSLTGRTPAPWREGLSRCLDVFARQGWP
jgi:dTDP-4-dehydrorhamnose reductase